MATGYAQESIWFDKWRYDDAERQYYEKQAVASTGLGSLANQIAKAREEIQNSLATGSSLASNTSIPAASSGSCPETSCRFAKLEQENSKLFASVAELEATLHDLLERVKHLELGNVPKFPKEEPKPAPQPPKVCNASPPAEDDDDDIDLFGSDEEEEDAAAAKVREERLKAYADKKSKKPGPIAKSSVLLDCKPWDDETDMKEMENIVRKIEMDGLSWGAAKLVPLAYGIMKLSILCIVEDEKVSIDDLIEKITENEDFVQSVDIAAFNKI